MSEYATLSLDLKPPLWVPLRFFFTAPLFGIVACVVFLIYGPDAMVSRWTTATLAVTHLFTLGYLSMVMMGALSQLLPVLIGSPIARPALVGSIVHGLLILGVCALVVGFLTGSRISMQLAVLILAAVFLIFTSIMIWCLVKAPKRDDSVLIGVVLAVVALVESVFFGLNLATERAWIAADIVPASWTVAHFTLGLIGWVNFLLISIAYVVVPLFQGTPQYPKKLKRWLHLYLLVNIGLWLYYVLSTMTAWEDKTTLRAVFSSTLATGLGLFAVVTLYLQMRRQTKQWDITVYYWRLAMIALLSCVFLWIFSRFNPQLQIWPRFDYLLGVTFIGVFGVSAINGMLYKIVPFLVWLHLQDVNRKNVPLRKLKAIIENDNERRQFSLHLSALILFIAAAIKPEWFLYPAATLFILSFIYLLVNLYSAIQYYQTTKLELSK